MTESLKELVFGWFREHEKLVDDEFNKIYMYECCFDCSVGCIPNIFCKKTGGSGVQMIHFSESRITGRFGEIRGDTDMFGDGIESYYHIFNQLGKQIARNLQECIYLECVEHDFKFYHHINFDRGTQCDPDAMRSSLVYYIKKHLPNVEQSDTTYKNPHGLVFDFREYFIIVCYIIYIYIYITSLQYHCFFCSHHRNHNIY